MIESWCIDKNNITGDPLREWKSDSADVTCTWFQTMSDSYIGIFRDCIDELDRRWVGRRYWQREIRTVLFPEPLGPITLEKSEIQCLSFHTYSKPTPGNNSHNNHIVWRQYHFISFQGSQRAAIFRFNWCQCWVFLLITCLSYLTRWCRRKSTANLCRLSGPV